MAGPGAKYDVIVWGASGFVGKLICEYLFSHYGKDRSLRWAMGGRSQTKMEEVRAGLGAGAKDIPIITGDAADADALNDIVQQTKVVLTTVGPYANMGQNLSRHVSSMVWAMWILRGKPSGSAG